MYKLREIKKEDICKINEWRNDAELISFLGAPFRYINIDVDYDWFENYMKNRTNTVRCAIVDEDFQQNILGLITLSKIDQLNQSAELHIMIGDRENHNKGIGSYAVNEMLFHAFYNLNLQRVELNVLSNNKRAIHLYEKCGFQYEGRRRNACYKNGTFVDMCIYAILRNEYSKESMCL